jgi:hypothetical protein
MDDAPVDREVELARLREENAQLRQQAELHRTAHDYLVRLAHHFSNEEVVFESPQEIRTFCERIKRSVAIMVTEFRELLRGRRQFQLDYNLLPPRRDNESGAAGGTRIIRLGDLHGDLGRYLFSWRPRFSEAEKEQDEDLRTAIEELKHHQMALLTGLSRCLKEGTLEVLAEVSPENIEEGRSHGGSGRSLLVQLNPFHAGRCWRKYRERFKDLSSEDVGWFQKKFLPSLREGYKEYMWKKNVGPSQEQSPSNEGER